MKTTKKKINKDKECDKTKRSQSKKLNGKGKPIDVQAVYHSLDYLHPKNQLTKKVYETVCKMQEILDALNFQYFCVSFVVSRVNLTISIQSMSLPEISVWNMDTDNEEVLLPEVLCERYLNALNQSLKLFKGAALARELLDVVEELPSEKELEEKELSIDGSASFFIGHHFQHGVERLSNEGSLEDMLKMTPPNELPNTPNTYFIFERFHDNSCLPVRRWTKKNRWKKPRETDGPCELIID